MDKIRTTFHCNTEGPETKVWVLPTRRIWASCHSYGILFNVQLLLRLKVIGSRYGIVKRSSNKYIQPTWNSSWSRGFMYNGLHSNTRGIRPESYKPRGPISILHVIVGQRERDSYQNRCIEWKWLCILKRCII